MAGGNLRALFLRTAASRLSVIPSSRAEGLLMYINRPNNPPGACDSEFFADVVAFAKENEIIVCHDAPIPRSYDDIAGFLQVSGAKDIGIEIHSLSKTYNMPVGASGWRSGRTCFAGSAR
jgi:aspartate/methionine/tyrosine aminotransferase